MLTLNEMQDFLNKNPDLYKIGKLELNQLDFDKSKYISIKNYTKEEILKQGNIDEPIETNFNWDLIFLCVLAYMSRDNGEDIIDEIKFKRRPLILVKNLTGNDPLDDLMVSPGFQRVFWAQRWGFKTCEFIFCDTVNRFNFTSITDASTFFDGDDSSKVFYELLPYKNFHYFDGQNSDSWPLAKSTLVRLCRSWTKEKTCFELKTTINLNEEQLAIIEVLADVYHKKITGNGWEIINHGPNLGTTQYYNYPKS